MRVLHYSHDWNLMGRGMNAFHGGNMGGDLYRPWIRRFIPKASSTFYKLAHKFWSFKNWWMIFEHLPPMVWFWARQDGNELVKGELLKWLQVGNDDISICIDLIYGLFYPILNLQSNIRCATSKQVQLTFNEFILPRRGLALIAAQKS